MRARTIQIPVPMGGAKSTHGILAPMIMTLRLRFVPAHENAGRPRVLTEEDIVEVLKGGPLTHNQLMRAFNWVGPSTVKRRLRQAVESGAVQRRDRLYFGPQ